MYVSSFFWLFWSDDMVLGHWITLILRMFLPKGNPASRLKICLLAPVVPKWVPANLLFAPLEFDEISHSAAKIQPGTTFWIICRSPERFLSPLPLLHNYHWSKSKVFPEAAAVVIRTEGYKTKWQEHFWRKNRRGRSAWKCVKRC